MDSDEIKEALSNIKFTSTGTAYIQNGKIFVRESVSAAPILLGVVSDTEDALFTIEEFFEELNG